MRRLFTWRMNLYRLLVGAIVLAIVIPARVFGVHPIWFIALVGILVVIVAVIAGRHVPSMRE